MNHPSLGLTDLTVTDWLEAHEFNDGWKLAPTLVAAGLDPEALDKIITHTAPDCLGDVLTWLEATLTGAELLDEVKLGSARISELVKAMKDYSYMDQAPLQEVDVHEGIESTLTILGHKLKQGVVVKREYSHLPRICAYGPQLNQVWTNLMTMRLMQRAVRGISGYTPPRRAIAFSSKLRMMASAFPQKFSRASLSNSSPLKKSVKGRDWDWT